MVEVTPTHTLSSHAAVAIVVAGLLLGPSLEATSELPAALSSKVTLAQSPASASEHYNPFIEMTLVPREQASLIDFYAGLLSQQEELGKEFAEVLFENAWDLYAR